MFGFGQHEHSHPCLFSGGGGSSFSIIISSDLLTCIGPLLISHHLNAVGGQLSLGWRIWICCMEALNDSIFLGCIEKCFNSNQISITAPLRMLFAWSALTSLLFRNTCNGVAWCVHFISFRSPTNFDSTGQCSVVSSTSLSLTNVSFVILFQDEM